MRFVVRESWTTTSQRTALVERPQGLIRESKGLLADIAWAPHDFQLKAIGNPTNSVRSPSFCLRKATKVQSKKSYDALVNCKHIHGLIKK